MERIFLKLDLRLYLKKLGIKFHLWLIAKLIILRLFLKIFGTNIKETWY